MENMIFLVNELRKLDHETPWVEFKHNNYDPKMIGSDICALANAAALHEKSQAYMLWGINDHSHDIVGTKYNLQNLKKANRNWKTGFGPCFQIMQSLCLTRSRCRKAQWEC